MRQPTLPAKALLAVAILAAAPGVWAQRQSLEDRVERLEKLVNTGSLVDLLDRVDALQREVRSLRGDIEQQSHDLDQVKQRQRELYLDVDRRLRRLEAGGVAPTAAPQPGVAPPTAAHATAPGQPAPATPAPVPTSPETAGAAPGAGPAAQSAAPGQTSADAAKEQAAYQQAFDLLKVGRYDQATKAFQDFLAQYPNGGYADNAQYWLGEAYYVTRQFPQALAEFTKLVTDHPDSSKASHALLKIGYIHHEMGDVAQARKVLQDLIARFPDTAAARLAQERLQRLKAEAR